MQLSVASLRRMIKGKLHIEFARSYVSWYERVRHRTRDDSLTQFPRFRRLEYSVTSPFVARKR